jgi:hypothetical protein
MLASSLWLHVLLQLITLREFEIIAKRIIDHVCDAESEYGGGRDEESNAKTAAAPD